MLPIPDAAAWEDWWFAWAITNVAPVEFLDAREARRLVVSEPYDDSPEQRSLIRRNLALRLDRYFVPLAVADQSIFMRLNEAAASTRPGGEQRVGARTAHPDGAGRIPTASSRLLRAGSGWPR